MSIPAIPPDELRSLIREMVRQFGPTRAAFEWFINGLPAVHVAGPYYKRLPSDRTAQTDNAHTTHYGKC